ncbi:MAG: ribonuclease HII [Spirochaetales bacterium]|nr:ribonuclease HII [Spirochaetales bacterium]
MKEEQDTQLSLFEEPSYTIVVGADEAGRGPLAGPVCAAAVVLPSDFPFEILNDSKKLSEKRRELAEPIIKEKAIAWAVAWATHREIDRINILQASMLAMKRAYLKVESQLALKGMKAEILLVDGNRRPDVSIPCKAIVKGDATVHEIMAASILAKNARDRLMVLCSSKWPQYGFEKHKGYPCASHKAALHKYGPCPIHRLTFKY